MDDKNVEDEPTEQTEPEWVDILGSGHLLKKILRSPEKGIKPLQSYICTINLKGCLEDGSVVEELDNYKVQIGDAELVHGLDLILPLMEIGELSEVKVGPRFGYGTLGLLPYIEPNSTIIYTVELLSAKEPSEVEDLPLNDRMMIGNLKKERGNWWYARQENNYAIRCYRRALDYLDDIEGPGSNRSGGDIGDVEKDREELLNELFAERLKVYNNLAAAQMKIKAFDSALSSVESVLRCQPRNVKALFRKGKILAAQGENSEAVKVLTLARSLEPENITIKHELVRLQELHQKDTKKVTNLYKKMLGQDKEPKTSSSTKSKNWPITWAVVFGSVAAMVVGIVAYRTKFL